MTPPPQKKSTRTHDPFLTTQKFDSLSFKYTKNTNLENIKVGHISFLNLATFKSAQVPWTYFLTQGLTCKIHVENVLIEIPTHIEDLLRVVFVNNILTLVESFLDKGMGSFYLGYCYNTLHYTLLRYSHFTLSLFVNPKINYFFKQKFHPELCVFSAAYEGSNRLGRSEIKLLEVFVRMF